MEQKEMRKLLSSDEHPKNTVSKIEAPKEFRGIVKGVIKVVKRK